DLYLDDVTSDATILDGLPVIGTQYAIGAPLTDGDSYRWYVRAHDNYGDVGLSAPALEFRVSAPPPAPPTPTLTGPIGQVKGASPTFRWTPVSGAVGYALFVKDTNTGNIVYGGLPVTSTSYTPSTPLPGDDTYDWYVRAIYADGSLGPAPPDAD